MNVLRLNVGLACFGLLVGMAGSAQAQLKPDKRLTQKISVDDDAAIVADVLKELGDKYKLPIDVIGDTSDITESSRITLVGDGVTLGSVLHLICESKYLVSYLEKGRMKVARVDEDEKNMTPRQYSLVGIVPAIDPQVLAGLYLPQFTSGLWKDVDQEGGEVLALSPQAITVRHTRTVHAELQNLFGQLSAAATNRPKLLSPQEKAEQAMLRKLQTPVQLAAGEVSLKEFLDQLLKKEQIPYTIDLTALEDESIAWKDLKITIDDTKQSPASRLDALSTDHNLSWRFADEFVQLTTQTKGTEQMSIRVYDIRKKIGPNQPPEAFTQKLLSDKELGPWQADEGEGGAFMILGTSLVIRHSTVAHAKIAKLIN